MNRITVLGAVALLASVAPVAAETPYRERNMFRTGYSDRSLGEGRWRVTAVVDRDGSHQRASHMALYRAAELARGAGYDYVQIVWHRGRMAYQEDRAARRMTVLNFSTELKVQGLRDPAAAARCEMQSQSSCLIKSTQQIIDTLAPTFAG